MTPLTRFARLLGIRDDQAEDALHSERAARHVLSRRSFFGVSAAMAAGTVWSFGAGAEAAPAVIAPSWVGPFIATGCIAAFSAPDFMYRIGVPTGVPTPVILPLGWETKVLR